MPDDGIDDLQQLGAEFRHLADHFGSADHAVPEEAEGNDDTGSVTVTVAKNGALKDLLIKQDWQSHLDPTTIAGAVMEAYGAASGVFLEAFGNAYEGPTDENPDFTGAPTLPASSPETELDLTDMSVTDFFRVETELSKKLDNLGDMVDKFAAAAEAAGADRAIGGVGGVEVAVSPNGTLLEIAFDPAWVAQTSTSRVRTDTLEAYAQAARQAVQLITPLAGDKQEIEQQLAQLTNMKDLARILGVGTREI